MSHLAYPRRQNTVLVIEDNTYLRQLLQSSLTNAGYNVITNADGKDIPNLLTQKPIDLVMLDLILPDISGKVILSDIRQSSEVPIIVISAFADPDSLVECLSLGADEYITKPFSFNIMLARVEALIRRMDWNSVDDSQYRTHEVLFELDKAKREVVIEGRRERLTPQEYRVLQYFVHHPNSIVSAETLMQEVWATDCLSNTLISSMVRRLRNKIEPTPAEPQFLQTVWGRGYRLCTDKADALS